METGPPSHSCHMWQSNFYFHGSVEQPESLGLPYSSLLFLFFVLPSNLGIVITQHGDRTTLTQLPGDHHVWQCNLSTFMAPVNDQNPLASLGRIFRKNYFPGRELTPGNCYAGILPSFFSFDYFFVQSE
eukprot:Phypoly_transcript_14615.p1 GENE.Phypoly_transcript_14615~~Phypoly_transcript_14615.p1  ORF type:complete len:129 (-),score=11.18 Phypoly_transcript_14615:210-596(-)